MPVSQVSTPTEILANIADLELTHPELLYASASALVISDSVSPDSGRWNSPVSAEQVMRTEESGLPFFSEPVALTPDIQHVVVRSSRSCTAEAMTVSPSIRSTRRSPCWI